MFPKTYSRKDKYFWTSSMLKRVTMTNCLLTYKYSEILHWHRGVKMNVRRVVSRATPATTFQISGFGVWVLSGIYILSCELKIYGKVVQLTLDNRGESGVLPPQCGWKSTHNFWPPPLHQLPLSVHRGEIPGPLLDTKIHRRSSTLYKMAPTHTAGLPQPQTPNADENQFRYLLKKILISGSCTVQIHVVQRFSVCALHSL